MKAHSATYFCGIDWASQKHDICVVDPDGQILTRLCIDHTAEGLSELLHRLGHFPCVAIAIERPSGLLVDTLLEAGFSVVPIHPNQLKASRARYSAAPAKSDPGDAYILADLLRTDGHRFRPLHAPSDQTKALRAAVRTRDDLVETRVRLSNQLRALLESFWPGPLGLFSQLHSCISLAFLEHYPTPQRAARLGEQRMRGFLKKQRYCGRTSAAELLHRLRRAPAGEAGERESQMKGELVRALVAVLRTTGEQVRHLEKKISEALQEHPDARWLKSFPCIADTNAAQILSELGDDPARYTSLRQLCAEAGVAPVTKESGRRRAVVFRYACNKRLRFALTMWAHNSRAQSPWAADVYERARARGCSHPHALRILARAWLRVLWKCWQKRMPYEPDKHGAAQAFEQRRLAA